jgi:hypothetical protein
MTAAAAMTHREAVLAHLGQYPDLTAGELARAIGARGTLHKLLRDMEQYAQVMAIPGRRPGQGGPVSVWRVAPPGTVPPPEAAPSLREAERRRARDRAAARARRARQREAPAVPVPALPPGAACAGADPEIFFPAAGGDETEAMAICARCPIRAACYARAKAAGECHGIWGGVNFERQAKSAGRLGEAS